MSAQPPRRRPARRRSRAGLWLAAGTSLAMFLLGLSFGRALEDGPRPAETRTSVRTLRPLPLAPAAATTQTVVVTVTTGKS